MDPKSFKSGTATFTIDLHPSRANDALDGVRDHLNGGLVRWNDGLGGIFLAYSGESITASQATIHPVFPYIRVRVNADVLLFRPKAGQSMVGMVNKLGTDYVGLLVLGVFNVAIGRAQIREDLSYNDLEHCWESRTDPSQRIEEGCHVRFIVDRLNTQGEYFSMTGTLLDPSTGRVPTPLPQGDGLAPLGQVPPGIPLPEIVAASHDQARPSDDALGPGRGVAASGKKQHRAIPMNGKHEAFAAAASRGEGIGSAVPSSRPPEAQGSGNDSGRASDLRVFPPGERGNEHDAAGGRAEKSTGRKKQKLDHIAGKLNDGIRTSVQIPGSKGKGHKGAVGDGNSGKRGDAALEASAGLEPATAPQRGSAGLSSQLMNSPAGVLQNQSELHKKGKAALGVGKAAAGALQQESGEQRGSERQLADGGNGESTHRKHKKRKADAAAVDRAHEHTKRK